MPITLLGGSKRFAAEVDKTFRLLTRTVAENSFVDAAKRGEGFGVLTSDITLTTAGESALLYYQNDEPYNMIVQQVDLSISDSLAGAALNTRNTCTLYLHPGIGVGMTGGTGTPAFVSNAIVGAPAQFENTSEQGQQGAVITGSPAGIPIRAKSGQTLTFPLLGILPKGAVAAFSFIPPVGNTNIKVSIAINAYLDK